MFTIAHPLFAVPCNWILERYGMRIGFIIGGFLVVGGVWLRILIAEERILFCLMGSVLAALGNIFILNSPSKMAANWFKTESIPNTVFLAVLANLISITLGASVPGLVLTENSTQDNITFFLQL